ncbi:ABC transporter ATP-binding protein [Natrialba swarupiae]|uniref:Probable branched-chain amino acid transport ATP-binding protein LivG n=1 Tax=Natrialba swarupiae TaxID=2448032 RepID=A0A5D5ALF4_9EURY|nr:ABC transporter ATP-binding protein [Natrialba swarupiae]TYT62599.1 ABC transporter ATP-binding protein [Natrialba swarupiae]
MAATDQSETDRSAASTDTTARSAILRTEGLAKLYGELVAVDYVDLSVSEGDFHSIIGPNGAGKTTLLDLITGGREPTAGSIYFEDEDITDLESDELVHEGIARSFQITSVLDGLTVFENVRLATQAIQYGSLSKVDTLIRKAGSHGSIDEQTREILEQIGLEDQAQIPAQNLSYGDRRKLEIGIVLATDPKLVLLDEPTAGMSIDKKHETIELIEDVLADATVILVEHDVELVMQLSDQITVLHQGQILADGTPDEIADNQEVQDAYLGGHTDE